MTFQDLVHKGWGHFCRPLPDPFLHRIDDPLLGGQQFCGRVAPVAIGEGDDLPAPGPDVLGAPELSGSARTRTTSSRSRRPVSADARPG